MKASTSPEARNHRTRWTITEMHYVEAHYRLLDLADIAARLGRTVWAVKAMANKLKCTEKPAPQWGEAEKEVLLRHYESRKPLPEIVAMLPGRSCTAVMAMAGKMGLTRPENIWTQEELICLNRYYPSEGQRILRRLPNKSDEAIRFKAREQGLKSPGYTHACLWDEREWQLLSKHSRGKLQDLLPLFPGRSQSSIKNALIRLKRAEKQGAMPARPANNKRVTTAWSEAEKTLLIRWFGTHKPMDEILAMLPGRPRSSVFSFAGKLGLSRPTRHWTTAELLILREYYPTEGAAVAQRLPGRRLKTISLKAFQLGIGMTGSTARRPWSAEEQAHLESHLYLSLRELQHLFPDRSLSSIKNARHRAKTRSLARAPD